MRYEMPPRRGRYLPYAVLGTICLVGTGIAVFLLGPAVLVVPILVVCVYLGCGYLFR